MIGTRCASFRLTRQDEARRESEFERQMDNDQILCKAFPCHKLVQFVVELGSLCRKYLVKPFDHALKRG